LTALFLYLIYLVYKLIMPNESKGFANGFKGFGQIITNIINFVLLCIVYFIGVGITSIIVKISGKHFLDMKTKKYSYWVKLNLSKKKFEDYYRQF